MKGFTMQTITVNFKDDGKKINTLITSIYPKLNVNNLYKALRQKDIKVNGKRINNNVTVNYGDEIQIYISDDLLNGINKKIEIPIIYEDDNIVVFKKPYDMEVEGENSLTSIMKKNYTYLEPCHRIDRNTIGIVIFAKNEDSLTEIEKIFKEKEIEKHYVALCYGIPKANATLNAYLFKESKKSIVYISKEPKKGYSKITTSYRLLKQNTEKNLSLLDVTLHTGKTHQIRAHLAFAGLPILGDGKYGSYEINKRFKVYKQLLCSYSITFHVSENSTLYYLNEKNIKLNGIPFQDYLK